MENMENNGKNEPLPAVRILFCLGIASMIFFNFFCVEPYGEFKNGIFFLLSILLILVLAESFDNFSIGQIVSIKREIKNKEKENKKLEQRNTELISHIISITNTQTQKQQSTNIFAYRKRHALSRHAEICRHSGTRPDDRCAALFFSFRR